MAAVVLPVVVAVVLPVVVAVVLPVLPLLPVLLLLPVPPQRRPLPWNAASRPGPGGVHVLAEGFV